MVIVRTGNIERDIGSCESFDPYSDIVPASNGAWQWKDPQSELAQSAKNYFLERLEDDVTLDLLGLDPLLR